MDLMKFSYLASLDNEKLLNVILMHIVFLIGVIDAIVVICVFLLFFYVLCFILRMIYRYLVFPVLRVCYIIVLSITAYYLGGQTCRINDRIKELYKKNPEKKKGF